MSDFKDDNPLEAASRDLHRSLAVRFGTSSPYRWDGEVRLRRVGFASIPRIVVPVLVARDAVSAIIPLGRQRAFGWLAERGVSDAHVGFQAHWAQESTRGTYFIDANPSSDSEGKRKLGMRGTVEFDLSRMLAGAVDWRSSYDGHLPERWEN